MYPIMLQELAPEGTVLMIAKGEAQVVGCISLRVFHASHEYTQLMIRISPLVRTAYANKRVGVTHRGGYLRRSTALRHAAWHARATALEGL
jgi:hypothetical protein